MEVFMKKLLCGMALGVLGTFVIKTTCFILKRLKGSYGKKIN